MWIAASEAAPENQEPPMTFQIILVNAIEEGPVHTSSSRLPNAYETLACARAVANRMTEAGWCDWARVVAWGTNDLPVRFCTADSFVDDIAF
jgi:hypothetical protein